MGRGVIVFPETTLFEPQQNEKVRVAITRASHVLRVTRMAGLVTLRRSIRTHIGRRRLCEPDVLVGHTW